MRTLLSAKDAKFLEESNREMNTQTPNDGHGAISLRALANDWTTSTIRFAFAQADKKLKRPSVLGAFEVATPGCRVSAGGILRLPMEPFSTDRVVVKGDAVVKARTLVQGREQQFDPPLRQGKHACLEWNAALCGQPSSRRQDFTNLIGSVQAEWQILHARDGAMAERCRGQGVRSRFLAFGPRTVPPGRTVPERCLFAYWARRCRDTLQHLCYVSRHNKQISKAPAP